MRKILYLTCVLVVSGILTTSCLDNNDSNAKITANYYGVLGGIQFSDSADTVFYTYIDSALTSMGKIRTVWQESAEVDFTAKQSYVLDMANEKASKTFQNSLSTITLSSVKNEIFKCFSDSMTMKGYTNASAIPLDKFSASFPLYTLYTPSTVVYPMAIDTLKHDVQ